MQPALKRDVKKDDVRVLVFGSLFCKKTDVVHM